MSLQNTPRSERIHIAFFGKRNSGKSSVLNAVSGQSLSIVSEVLGTTTDPVFKSMELLPLGPCVLIDTAGLDDAGELGALRVKKTLEVLEKTDIALLVTEGAGLDAQERSILKTIGEKGIPVAVVLNKADINPADEAAFAKEFSLPAFSVSAKTGEGVLRLREGISRLLPQDLSQPGLLDGLAAEGDVVVLVTPIDSAAPKGRMILPQQQAIRALLDIHAVGVTVQVGELAAALAMLQAPPRLVITDSQAFDAVSAIVPDDIPLTSFSMVFARYKGDLAELAAGAEAIGRLRDGDRVLIAEACTHHTQCDDIGRVKIPRMLQKKTGKTLDFEFSAGGGYRTEEELSNFALVIHCGACMIPRRQMLSRMKSAARAGVPIVNYGVLLAALTGILPRAREPFAGA